MPKRERFFGIYCFHPSQPFHKSKLSSMDTMDTYREGKTDRENTSRIWSTTGLIFLRRSLTGSTIELFTKCKNLLIARKRLRGKIIEKNGVDDIASVDQYDFKVGFLTFPIISSNARKHRDFGAHELGGQFEVTIAVRCL